MPEPERKAQMTMAKAAKQMNHILGKGRVIFLLSAIGQPTEHAEAGCRFCNCTVHSGLADFSPEQPRRNKEYVLGHLRKIRRLGHVDVYGKEHPVLTLLALN